MRVMYFNDDGDLVEGEMTFNGLPYPPRTRMWNAIAAAEWDLIARYDRGEFGASYTDTKDKQ